MSKAQVVGDDFVLQIFKHIVTSCKGFIESPNPCAMRKHIWGSEGINEQWERFNTNKSKAERVVSKMEINREARIAQERKSALSVTLYGAKVNVKCYNSHMQSYRWRRRIWISNGFIVLNYFHCKLRVSVTIVVRKLQGNHGWWLLFPVVFISSTLWTSILTCVTVQRIVITEDDVYDADQIDEEEGTDAHRWMIGDYRGSSVGKWIHTEEWLEEGKVAVWDAVGIVQSRRLSVQTMSVIPSNLRV